MILAIIIFKVLIKRMDYIHNPIYSLEVPLNLNNVTTSANAKCVFVKYDDYTAYPQFIVYYS